ncbi:MAG: DUF1622 domain-containing protein [Limnospira sp. PMC 1291.21]|uniref:DUF1622 domain-containing protein n=3 Tax=Limnospira TaxID=2596745 RepID=A0A9P1NZY2_9CYAN|nr:MULTISPECIES: DUF1622 domain-containing protein [Limnospira]EKD07391.1 hypothetical protein SPLC1_S410580 [Arthrospira platensis C1]MBD2671737.1 DUF1622 domain-containing protein [Arthrospira platensis FACHB-439]MDC0838863.1 DUF1622 domain-containing protein [Limnoraphis robusta]QJB25729.1 DUF1622 domain-containing protein [Limnospira fusiformis SAG 85.79]EDZ91977.1 protein of unknown function DUF1622 [Limnospira maxima CS-328]
MMLNGLATELSGIVVSLNGILTGFCQLLALFVIAIGVTRALVIFIKDALFKGQATEAFQRGRLVMGYSFSLALSFLIGATILKTMISSRWDDIARLAAIIAVRTVLNYLLLQAISKATPEVEQISTPAET